MNWWQGYSLILCLNYIQIGFALCVPTGDEVSYGTGSWIGYVYSEQNNFSTANYVGFINQSENFNQTFPDDSLYTTSCATNLETFTIRFKMTQTYACGLYTFTVGGDDGFRFSIDGGTTWLLNRYVNQAYTTRSTSVFLDGTYNLVIEYFEASGQQRVSFNSVQNSIGSAGGIISGDQTFCSPGTVNPAAFSSLSEAGFCTPGADPINYYWQQSADNITFSNISGANALTYDYPANFPADTTVFFRRIAVKASDTVFSNVLSVQNFFNDADESEVGIEQWIGHVYDGTANFNSSNYLGTITELVRFDENFGGNNAIINTSGCNTEANSFTVRYKAQINFPSGVYTFTIGGDDGVRLSLDGGSTYFISDWSNHGYRTTSGTDTLNGTYILFFDYYENGGGNRVSFDYVLDVPLPVSLTHFSASLQNNNQVLISWVTASELNNHFFTVERSINGINFFPIAKIEGSGTTNVHNNYNIKDVVKEEGRYFYRLTQTDFDGEKTVFNPVSVKVFETDESENFHIYPNPVKQNNATIVLKNETGSLLKVSVVNMLGEIILIDYKVQEFENEIKIDIHFPTQTKKGAYFISIQTAQKTITQKLILD